MYTDYHDCCVKPARHVFVHINVLDIKILEGGELVSLGGSLPPLPPSR